MVHRFLFMVMSRSELCLLSSAFPIRNYRSYNLVLDMPAMSLSGYESSLVYGMAARLRPLSCHYNCNTHLEVDLYPHQDCFAGHGSCSAKAL